jgi:hypothetical protein
VAVRAARRGYDDQAALGLYEAAGVVVGELVARFGHGHVVPRTTDSKHLMQCVWAQLVLRSIDHST